MSVTDDQISQFAAMLGSCLDSARLAHLPVELELEDATVVSGMVGEPATTNQDADEFDHSGTRENVEVGQTVVVTARVRRYSILRPS